MTLAPILRRDAISPDVDILEHHDEVARSYFFFYRFTILDILDRAQLYLLSCSQTSQARLR